MSASVLQCVVQMNRGGYETMLMNVYREIDKSKLQFDFISSMKGEYDEEIIAMGGKIHYIPFITKVGPLQYAASVKRVLKENPQYTIVHSHMDKFSGMIMREAKKCNVPVRISHAHSTQNEGGLLYQAVKNYYGNMINKYSTHLFACSRAAAQWMFGEKANQAEIFYNGINLQAFSPNIELRNKARAKIGLENSVVVGHVGRFTHPKNHSFLIDLFSEFLKTEPNAKLVLVGNGPLHVEMQEKVKKMGIREKVLFLGQQRDIPLIMQAFDMFVFPSHYEGLGMVLIEAQASGLPCIVSNTIPEEAFVSDNVSVLSLKDPFSKWVNAMQGKEPFVKKHGDILDYDINKLANWLQAFYLDKI